MSDDDHNHSRMKIDDWYRMHEEAIEEFIQWVMGGEPASPEVELALVNTMPTEVFKNGDLLTGMIIGLQAAVRVARRPENAYGYVDCDSEECDTPHMLVDVNGITLHVTEVSKALLDLGRFHDGLA